MRPLAFAAAPVLVATVVLAQGPARPPGEPTPTQQPAPSPDTQVFRGGIDLIQVDVSVVDRRGRPVTDLLAPEFAVIVDGKPRKVASAEFVSLRGPSAAASRDAVQSSEAGVSTNIGQVRGRLVVIVVDRDSISFGGGRNATTAAARFLDKLTVNDRVAFVSIPQPGPFVDFTTNHARVQAELERFVGLGRTPRGLTKNLGVQESLVLIRGNDPVQEREILQRFCGQFALNSAAYLDCVADVRAEALAIVQQVEQQAQESIRSLAAILESLRDIEGPKSLVWISEGLVAEDGGGELVGLDRLASAANTTVHVLLLDAPLFDITERFQSPSASRDRELQVRGLEMLAGHTRGALYRVSAGADIVFDRLEEEVSGYYLLGVESLPADADGKRHDVEVSVRRQGMTVRARREFRVPIEDARSRERPEDRVARALRSPFGVTGLPLRVATYAYRSDSDAKIQVVVVAEIEGTGRTDASELTLGYLLLDADGNVVLNNVQRASLAPRDGLRGTVLEHLVLFTLEPGTYTLKFAAVDADGRRGSLEHPLEAWQMSGVDFAVSDLMLGDTPARDGEPLRPHVEALLAGNRLAAYLELYASDPSTLNDLAVRLELANPSGTTLGSVPGVLDPLDGGNRRIVRVVAPLGALTPGQYHARAIVTRGDRTLWELSRPFHVSPAASAAGLAALLPDLLAAAPFERAEVLTPDVLGAAVDELQRGRPSLAATLARVRKGELAGAARAAFDLDDQMAAFFLRGLEFYSNGDLNRAASQLNDARRLAPDFAPATLYFGACFAAGGRDRDALDSWRRVGTASALRPVLQALSADALARLGETGQLITLLSQASAEFPQDDGLRHRLARAHAAAGRHKEALAAIEPYLDRHPADPEALFLALHAIYASRLAGEPVVGAADAAERMARYGKAYAAAKGPRAALVASWVASLTPP